MVAVPSDKEDVREREREIEIERERKKERDRERERKREREKQRETERTFINVAVVYRFSEGKHDESTASGGRGTEATE